MLPREKGGVVDNTLKVYGTENLRVVDLSILPLQVASHLQSLCYSFKRVSCIDMLPTACVYGIAEQGKLSPAVGEMS